MSGVFSVKQCIIAVALEFLRLLVLRHRQLVFLHLILQAQLLHQVSLLLEDGVHQQFLRLL